MFKSSGFGVGLFQTGKMPGATDLMTRQEKRMNKFTRLLTLGLFSVALAAAPVVSKVYAAPDNDPPPSDSGKKKKKSSELRPGSEQTAFASGYRAAYTAIYDRGEYASAIEQLKA